MWIDFERRHGLLVGMFFGRQSWLYGADGSGAVVEEAVYLPHSRARRITAIGYYGE